MYHEIIAAITKNRPEITRDKHYPDLEWAALKPRSKSAKVPIYESVLIFKVSDKVLHISPYNCAAEIHEFANPGDAADLIISAWDRAVEQVNREIFKT